MNKDVASRGRLELSGEVGFVDKWRAGIVEEVGAVEGCFEHLLGVGRDRLGPCRRAKDRKNSQ